MVCFHSKGLLLFAESWPCIPAFLSLCFLRELNLNLQPECSRHSLWLMDSLFSWASRLVNSRVPFWGDWRKWSILSTGRGEGREGRWEERASIYGTWILRDVIAPQEVKTNSWGMKTHNYLCIKHSMSIVPEHLSGIFVILKFHGKQQSD